MSSTTLADRATAAKQSEYFDTTLTVPNRLDGGTMVLDTEHVGYLGRDVIRVQAPVGLLHLDTHEARDLASALLNLANHIDEGVAR